MGVPSFYGWLKNKYRAVVVKASEDEGECINTSLPNPNGIEFDNFYLDMNSIIFFCFQPADQPRPPKTFEEVFNNIFKYVDNLFSIVRPRKLLYMAIDGVAPRAKMNQQRSKRFRTIKAYERHDTEMKRLIEQFEMEGKPVLLECLLPSNHKHEVSTSHVVTPGTEFVYKLSVALRSYVISRINNDPGWRDIKVIFSDANVPGEGEHKIMSFIRQQKSVSVGYNPNTRHCVYGLDADLIMLALATHEVHISILREEREEEEEREWFKKPYEFVNIWTLREYLELDMKISDPPANVKIDFERIVDDFIFFCFFLGNDFLPGMPSLEVHEDAIDLLISVYKTQFKNLGGYLLDMSRLVEEVQRKEFINLSRVEKFILLVGSYEDQIFRERSKIRKHKLRRLHKDSDNQAENEGGNMEIGTRKNSDALSSEEAPTLSDSAESNTLSDGSKRANDSEIVKNTNELINKCYDNLEKNSDLFMNDHLRSDKVRLGAAGWKERYYKERFSAETWRDIENQRKEIVKKYTEGLLWVLLHYYSEVPSWSWFYPYYYSPFASDLKDLAQVHVEFQKGSPLKPFDQLLAVVHPKRAHLLPKVYQPLLTDVESKIIDLYPTDFDIDFDGKRFMWQGIVKLPFIEEERLLSETKELEKGLQRDEALRNRNNVDQLYVSSTHNLASQILSLSPNENKVVEIDTSLSDGISGFIHLPNEDNEIVYKEVHNSMEENCVLCVSFEMCDDAVHLPRLLDGVIFPFKSITEGDTTKKKKLWHKYRRNKPSNRLQNETCDLIHEGYHRRFTTESYSDLVNKAGGIGWGAGRGKVNATTNTSKNIESRERVILPSSSFAEQKSSVSSWDAGKCYNSLVSSSCNLNELLRPHGGAQSMNHNFGPSRDGVRYGTDNVQQQIIQFGSIPTHQGRGHHGSTVSSTYSWKHSSATNSVQGRGISQDVQHSSVKESGSLNHNFGPSRDGVRYGTDNVQQQRIQFGSIPTHQGRGHHGSTVSPTYSWKHSSATSSVQGRGRSQDVQHSSVEESGSH